jgi:hypothetical protein
MIMRLAAHFHPEQEEAVVLSQARERYFKLFTGQKT